MKKLSQPIPRGIKTWTEKRARAATLRHFEKIANHWAEISALWGEDDFSLESEAEDEIGRLRDRFEEVQEGWAAIDRERQEER